MKQPQGAGGVLSGNGLKWALVAGIDIALLYIVTMMYAQGEIAFALVILLLGSIGTWVFTSEKAYNFRYVYPSLLGVILFVVFPLIYTVNIAFTNYSSTNLLPFERVKQIHLDKTYSSGEEKFALSLYQHNDAYQLQLTSKQNNDEAYTTEAFSVAQLPAAISANKSTIAEGDKLTMRDVIKLRGDLSQLTVMLPNQSELVMTSLREFGSMAPLFKEGDNQSLINNQTGDVYQPDHATGFYMSQDGERMAPGFTVYVGWDNFVRVLTDPGIQGPFWKILGWTVTHAGLTVLFTLIIGLMLACLVQWEPLKESGIYRVLLILPYAVPAFISILIFRGLFNQNFGEINMVLNSLFGISPEWFTNEYLAKAMILIVNCWLGYPYMMILTMGLLKAIPEDLYEASAIDGANPLHNLRHITVPMIIKPLIPLLIASFAFNFNNFVLINLLTGGGPNLIDASTPAGATDILVSYTFRIAFGSYGQDYGLASAIAGLIFVIVGVIAWANLKATSKLQEQ
ncbi:maltose ABC transporter permease MalF [Endozoicomonas euniceicola]|uniref:Maltose/maltodextrin transport system permease protein n=1 Tax=Endozoicomonas euniceicola TaxID=1234143 RepID=A0ABY6GX18_9GAMM|nr:maltose ABC transporter permease MalF [Endozoicomonas euniceicola]UYM17320.1 maltose ABC transporter permease MalF [Endozoicomonas euniceicola]